MEVKTIEYKGKKIQRIDNRGIKSEEELVEFTKQQVKAQKEALQQYNKFYDVLSISGGENIFSKESVDLLKETFQFRTDFKIAVVGMDNLAETVSRGVDEFTHLKNVKRFKTEEEALEWLVS